MTTSTPLPPFLRLPLELRYAIYDYLCPASALSYPYKPSSPIASIDIRGPSISLILTNRTIFEELSNYYFSRCTFRFVAQSFKPRSSDVPERSLQIVRKARKIELLVLPGTMKATATDPDSMSITVKQMSADWLDGQVGLLRDEAKQLKTVIVSMRRVSWNHGWSVREETEALLMPLKALKGSVEFRVGEVMGPGSVEEKMREELGIVLGRLNN